MMALRRVVGRSQRLPLNAMAVSQQQQQRRCLSTEKEPMRVAVTGAAGQIGYSLLFRIASGELLGRDQPVIIHGIELPPAMDALKGVAMELEDCAFPLLKGVVQTSDLHEGFDDVDVALLVGARPRGKGMERGDLLKANGQIFAPTGKAINAKAKRTVRVLVVGNPANTNCLIAAHNAPDIPAGQFTAMMRLDHDRALAQLAQKTNSHTTDIEKLVVWGNHSATQVPDISNALVGGKPAKEVVNDEAWISETFIPTVQKRGAAIIEARGLSSAASAGNAALSHIRDWYLGTNGGWVSKGVPSGGYYGIEEGIYFGFPVTCDGGEYSIVEGIEVDSETAQRIEATRDELLAERDMVSDLLV